jgi:hypothetical protein
VHSSLFSFLVFFFADAAESRFSQDTNTTSLTIDHPQQAQLLGIFPAPSLNTNTTYSQDGDTFFQPPNAHIYPGIDVRTRLPSKYVPSWFSSITFVYAPPFSLPASALSRNGLSWILAHNLTALHRSQRAWHIHTTIEHRHCPTPGLKFPREINTRKRLHRSSGLLNTRLGLPHCPTPP